MAKISFKQRVQTFLDNLKQIKIDRENRKAFINEMQHEVSSVHSTFNKYKLSIDGSYTTISCLVSIPENYQLSENDAMIYAKLKEETMPINKYLGQELNWGEYFVMPEFFHVEDEDDEGSDNVSCTYLATWTYTPILAGYPKFWYEFAVFIGINGLLALGLIGGILMAIL